MAAKYNLMPNESVIMQETSVAHGGAMAMYTDELILTNLNIVCISKGMFGNTKNIFQYPINQIKRFNGRPQTLMNKLSNGLPCLEIYFMNGASETFSFQTSNKKIISKWIDAINCIVTGNDIEDKSQIYEDDDYDPDTLAGAFKEVGDQFKEIGAELRDAFGFKPKKKKNSDAELSPVKVSKKCISCSAPLVGYKGKSVKCKYCDTEQIL